ncbi:MAG: YaiI/YqxD family protein [Gammaproteobacteria bacterium]
MQIWVDADACPAVIRDILFRAADRARMRVTLVANQPVRRAVSPYIHFVQVPAGLNVADARIVELMEPRDLVITADVPLAALVIEKGGIALDPRGTLYTTENVRERLSLRNFMDELRGSGVNTGGPASLGKRERQLFANQLDRWLARATPSGGPPAPAAGDPPEAGNSPAK